MNALAKQSAEGSRQHSIAFWRALPAIAAQSDTPDEVITRSLEVLRAVEDDGHSFDTLTEQWHDARRSLYRGLWAREVNDRNVKTPSH